MLSAAGEKELLTLLQNIPNELSEFVKNYIAGNTVPIFAKEALSVSLGKCSYEKISFLSKNVTLNSVCCLLKTGEMSSEVKFHLESLIF